MSLAKRTVEFGGKRGFWYTTADQVRLDSILKAIWTRASDLYSVRNEQIFQLADYGKSDYVSIFDSVGG